MKVLMLTTNGSLLDGINRHILSVAPEINRRENIEAAVCTVHPRGELAIELEKLGVRVFSLGAKHGHDVRSMPKFYKVVKNFKPDVIHSHVLSITNRIVLSLYFRDIPIVHTTHGINDEMVKKLENEGNLEMTESMPHKPTLRQRLEKWIYRKFPIKHSAICFISHGVRELILGKRPTTPTNTVVYNPLRFDYKPLSSKKLRSIIDVSENTPVIGTACRISHQKHPEAFTEVMCRVLKLKPDAHAVIMGAGDNSLVEKCKSIVDMFGVSDRFHWLGYCKDAPILTKELDCFVLTSRNEGLPTSILECMAGKTPFAMLEGYGGLEDLTRLNAIEGPFAAIRQKKDLIGLANDIVKILDDDTLRHNYAERAYEIGKRNFEVSIVTDKLTEIYKTVSDN